MSGTVLYSRDTSVNTIDISICPCAAHILVGESR